jgi:hypothetical protein
MFGAASVRPSRTGGIRLEMPLLGRELENLAKAAEAVDPSWDWKKKDEIEKGTEAKSLDGIISYLTKEHDENVEEKGIVTITSKSVKVKAKDSIDVHGIL